MISESEYLKAKKIVDDYENEKFQEGITEIMYCVECQALDAHECTCDESEDDVCPLCEGSDHWHSKTCPYNLNVED